jgi:hypothetical protein
MVIETKLITNNQKRAIKGHAKQLHASDTDFNQSESN